MLARERYLYSSYNVTTSHGWYYYYNSTAHLRNAPGACSIENMMINIPTRTIKVDPTKTIVIKKYPNRKLYATGQNRYIKYSEVVDLIINCDLNVQFIESRTGTDITTFSLSQILKSAYLDRLKTKTASELLTMIRNEVRLSHKDPSSVRAKMIHVSNACAKSE